MRLKLFIGFLLLFFVTQKSFGQNYFQREFQNKNSLNTLIEKDSINNYLPSNVYNEIWKKSEDINEKDAFGFYRRAADKYEQGLIDEAIGDLDRSILIDSSVSLSYSLRALCKIGRQYSTIEIIGDINKAIDLDSENWQAYNLKGYLSLNQNELSVAEDNFNKALEVKKDIPESYLYLGDIYFLKRKYYKAIRYYNKAIQLNKNLFEAYLKKAQSILFTDRYEDALEVIDELIEVNPENYKAYATKSDLYIIMGRFKEANKYINKGLEKKPNDYMLLLKKAVVAFGLNDFNTCYDRFNEAVFSDSSSINELGIDFKDNLLTKINIADYHFKGEQKIDKKYQNLYKRAVVHYIMKKSVLAFGEFQFLIENGVCIPEIFELNGILAYQCYDYNYAETSFQKALELNKDNKNAFVYINLGVVQSFQGYNKYAALNFLRALRIEPSNYKIYYFLAKINITIKEYGSAIAYLNKALELNPNAFNIFEERAELKNILRNFNGAISDYMRAIEHSPFNKNLYYTSAGIHIQNEEYELAEAILKRACAVDTADYEPLFVLGNYYYSQKEYNEAIRCYKKVKSKNSNKQPEYFEFYIAKSIQAKEKYIEAIELYKNIIKNYESRSFKVDNFHYMKTLVNIGRCYGDIADSIKKQDYFDKLMKFENLKSDYYLAKAVCFENVKEYNYSIECLERSLLMDSANYNTYIHLGKVFVKNRDYTGALDILNEAILVDSVNYQAYEVIGRVKYENKEYSDAIIYSKMAIERNPLIIKPKIVIMISEMLLGNEGEAKKIMDQIRNGLTKLELNEIKEDIDNLISQKNNLYNINELLRYLEQES
ncbi:MAG: tetratricopeptide repeat protein [Bacteroidales bacterium]|nr:tetratricopeptide repeat protein [Bacteroidales bacterium]